MSSPSKPSPVLNPPCLYPFDKLAKIIALSSKNFVNESFPPFIEFDGLKDSSLISLYLDFQFSFLAPIDSRKSSDSNKSKLPNIAIFFDE